MVRLNDAGRRNLAAIMSGTAELIAETRGWSNVRTMNVFALPDMTLRSAWAIGAGGLDTEDGRRLWREIGDGPYLAVITEKASGQTMYLAVQVEDGIADVVTINAEQAQLLPSLVVALNADPGGSLPAELEA